MLARPRGTSAIEDSRVSRSKPPLPSAHRPGPRCRRSRGRLPLAERACFAQYDRPPLRVPVAQRRHDLLREGAQHRHVVGRGQRDHEVPNANGRQPPDAVLHLPRRPARDLLRVQRGLLLDLGRVPADLLAEGVEAGDDLFDLRRVVGREGAPRRSSNSPSGWR